MTQGLTPGHVFPVISLQDVSMRQVDRSREFASETVRFSHDPGSDPGSRLERPRLSADADHRRLARKGARIFAPKGTDTRPTGDRVREAAFNLLGPGVGRGARGARPLRGLGRDGARGALARRRSARSSSSPTATPAARSTATSTSSASTARPSSARTRSPRSAAEAPRGQALRSRAARPALRRISSLQNALDPLPARDPRADGLLVVETAADEEPELPLAQRTSRRYGSARLTLFEHEADDHRDLPRHVRPRHERPRRRDHARGRRSSTGVVIGVVGNPQHKEPMFTLDERVALPARNPRTGSTTSRSTSSRELVVDFAHKWEAKVIVKGLRVISDFEWEFQMNQLNRTLAPEVETVYVMASPQVSFVSSSGVKEIASLRRKGGRARARARRTPVQGAVPGRPARNAGEPAGMTSTDKLETMLAAGGARAALRAARRRTCCRSSVPGAAASDAADRLESQLAQVRRGRCSARRRHGRAARGAACQRPALGLRRPTTRARRRPAAADAASRAAEPEPEPEASRPVSAGSGDARQPIARL